MSETGILAYGLADGWFCEECGRPKGNRWLLGVPSGCATCDDVITRHRCTGRPGIGELEAGTRWQCQDCGTLWQVTEEMDTCGECGRSGMVLTWSVERIGEYMDTAPRYRPQIPVPFRNLLASAGRVAVPVHHSGHYALPDACYSLPSGNKVHVRSACRC